jgi:hypothetical protein
MLMFETARYDDVYLRPYQTQFDQQVSNILYESSEGGRNYTPSSLASAASSFLRPSTEASVRANLSNGFGEKRFSFMMEITLPTLGQFGGGMRYIITGYTNHLGVANAAGGMHLDPNMQLFFNNVFELRDTYVPTPHGQEHQVNVAGSRHVLHNSASMDYMQSAPPQYTLRPEDVMGELEYSDRAFSGSDEVVNGLGVLSGVRLSDRSNESRPTYLAKTIKSFNQASIESDTYGDMSGDDHAIDGNNVWSHARDKVRDKPLSSNKFLMTVMNQTQYGQTGAVSYAELCRLLPDLDPKNEVILAGATAKASEYQPGQGESWASMAHETIMASILQQMTPAIMSDCLLTRVGFVATNDTIGGIDDVRVVDAKGFTHGIDYSRYIDHFIGRLQREVLQDLSHNGQVRYSVEVSINLLRDSYYRISHDGGPFVYHSAPSFCDGLYSPVVSGDHHSLENMAQDVSTMLNTINSELYVGRQTNTPIYGGDPSNVRSNLPAVAMQPYTGDTSI